MSLNLDQLESELLLPPLDTKRFRVDQYAVLLELFSALDTTLMGVINQQRCRQPETMFYNDAGEYIDVLIQAIFDAKLGLLEKLQGYQPNSRHERERRAYLLIQYQADTQSLSICELAKLAQTLIEPTPIEVPHDQPTH